MKRIALACVMLAMFFARPAEVLSCNCHTGIFSEAARHAPLVVIGVVTEVGPWVTTTKSSERPHRSKSRYVDIPIEGVWKATLAVKEVLRGGASIERVIFGGENTSCDFSASQFSVGHVYALAIDAAGTDSQPYVLKFCTDGWTPVEKESRPGALSAEDVRAAVRDR